MNTTKYLAEISIVGLILILGLSANVSAMPYISIGDATHNFTVVPGQAADISLPIMVKNASDDPVKGLQFNVTFNCSKINITNITEVEIVNVPTDQNPQRTEIYNKLCNGSVMPLGLQKAFCFFMNTTPVLVGGVNKTNASILYATVRNISNSTHPDQCVLRIAFANYEVLSGNVTIGKIRMKVGAMQNYFNNPNAILPMNITIEKMGANHSTYINVSNANIHSQARLNGLIKACRGDATREGIINGYDALAIAQYMVNKTDLSDIKDCLDVTGEGAVNGYDALAIAQYIINKTNINMY
ncbi:MAG: hypothetical protein CVT88_06970 [Candidatus Altiarchaeales archaeon HGW-Altiarchaeales-1]|nr:MAG: hypothetical protein CVT88_06970 [Candidatus Altiarchaeales archaeon HGW-Altiarchaeales-1]